MLVVAEQLKAAGINVDVQIIDWTTNASHMQQGTGDWNLSTTVFGPDHILGPQQWRPMIYTFPHINGNDALDNAYSEFFAAPTLEERRAAWLKIQQQVLGGAYLIKIADTGRLSGYSKKLQGPERLCRRAPALGSLAGVMSEVSIALVRRAASCYASIAVRSSCRPCRSS